VLSKGKAEVGEGLALVRAVPAQVAQEVELEVVLQLEKSAEPLMKHQDGKGEQLFSPEQPLRPNSLVKECTKDGKMLDSKFPLHLQAVLLPNKASLIPLGHKVTAQRLLQLLRPVVLPVLLLATPSSLGVEPGYHPYQALKVP
jgi:hypothetical protein